MELLGVGGSKRTAKFRGHWHGGMGGGNSYNRLGRKQGGLFRGEGIRSDDMATQTVRFKGCQ